MSALRTALALIAVALTSACAVGPNYRAPTTTPGAGPFVSAPPRLTTAQAPAADWWRLYDDPLLDGLVGEALVHNPPWRWPPRTCARCAPR